MTKQSGLSEVEQVKTELCCVRHGLVDGLDPITHCELVHYFLSHVVKIDLPGVVAASVRDLHRTLTEHVCGVVEEVLRNVYIRHVSTILISSDTFKKPSFNAFLMTECLIKTLCMCNVACHVLFFI